MSLSLSAHKHAALFVDAAGAPKPDAKVPNSCIESAEYVIQCIAQDKMLPWTHGDSRKPHVLAHFGNGLFCNISDADVIAWAFSNASTLVDYPFGTHGFSHLPKVGRGLMLLHKTKLESKVYHMHLAATVASWGSHPKTKIAVTDMFEAWTGPVTLQPLKVRAVSDIGKDFRDAFFGPQASEYVVGLLMAETDKGPHVH